MRPITSLLVFVVTLFWLIALVLRFPALLLGILMQPLMNRFPWIIEFLYPTAIGRWAHFFIIRLADRVRRSKAASDKSYGYHSRAMETRMEVVQNRVFVHPLPQLIDNLGYLIVCCPKESIDGIEVTENVGTVPASNGWADRVSIAHKSDQRIVAFVVDCGDAEVVARQIKLISKIHYNRRKIHVQSILSTHKHHDHTAGNKGLFHHEEMGRSIKLVFGGAVENVPECNYPLADGDKLPLPKSGANDMNEIVEVEAIATPAHTRGSLTYALRPLDQETSSVSTVMFTGDTMFSGGGGVPFESDIDPNQGEKPVKITANNYIKASASVHAVERCFAELLFRCVPDTLLKDSTSDQIAIFPGHEYTTDLINRQLPQPMENCRWKYFTPTVFFETVSHYYVSLHRRTLPHSNGKLLVALSPLSRELHINPNLRSLLKRGEIIITALRMWHHNFAKARVSDSVRGAYGFSGLTNGGAVLGPGKATSTDKQWNLDVNDLTAPVFTTVYATDLDKVIDDLDSGRIDTRKAARRLRELKNMLDVPLIGRRPIPGTLPSERMVYKGLVGLALLGSSPTALTLSDSKSMKLPPPIVTCSDQIRVSKKRLVAVLYWLGLLTEESDGERIVAILDQLWKEANEYESKLTSFVNESGDKTSGSRYNSTDVESSSIENDDQVDLGSLKWILYGIPSQRPSLFPQYCMPCTKAPGIVQDHPIHKSNMQRESGELVRHDIQTCPLCRNATGCPAVLNDEEDEVASTSSESLPLYTAKTEDDGDSSYIEIEPHSLGAMLREG